MRSAAFILAFHMLLVILTSSGVNELLKVQELIEHYFEHHHEHESGSDHHDLGIFDFFAMHYGDVDSHNEDHKHKDLPFQHSSSPVFACFIQQAIQVEFQHTFSELSLSFKDLYKNTFHSQYSPSFWQPPKLS